MLIQLFRYALSALIALSLLQPLKSAMADTLTVFVFNNQFSLNGPGNPVVSNATILEGDYIRWEWLQGNHTTT